MKKVFFALFIALATTLSFTSCSSDDDDITSTDIANQTFKGTDSGKTVYGFAFGTDGSFTSSIKDDDAYKTSATYTNSSDGGTYTVADNVVTLKFTDGTTKTMTGDGSSKLLYTVDVIYGDNANKSEQITLKKQ